MLAVIFSFTACFPENLDETLLERRERKPPETEAEADRQVEITSPPVSSEPITSELSGIDTPTGQYRDLGGLEVTIGIWWTPEAFDPATEFGRARLDYLTEIQSNHNFTIKEEYVTSHSQMSPVVKASVLVGTPVASVITLDPSNVLSMHKDGFFYDVGSLPSVNLRDEKWNRHVTEAMTFDGGIYGFANGYSQWNAGVVFFNKDVLREAGIDPETIYDMQANNTWTWDVMLDMAERVTQDIDGDGIVDFYGFCTFSKEMLTNAVFSNGARFADRDENGRFYNATNTTAFLRATEWVQSLQQKGLIQPPPSTADWNWWIEGFNEGRAAFRVHQDYSKNHMQNTTFDWGMVLFPRGPDADGMMSAYFENINIIPRIFSAEEADNIMFAYDLYTEPVPGFENDYDAWKYGAYNDHRDMRAVDETLALIRTGDFISFRYDYIIPGFDPGEITDTIWNLEAPPAILIEAASQYWNIWIEEANYWIFGE